MTLRATLQTKLACGALVIIITNVIILIAVIAFISKAEICRLNKKPKRNAFTYPKHIGLPLIHHSWIVAFVLMPDSKFIGTGTIISSKSAIISASCLQKFSKYPIHEKMFRGGNAIWYQYGYHHFAEKIFQHEKFDPVTLEFNIALVKVSRPFGYTHENPIAIATRQVQIKARKSAEIVGWVYSKNLTKIMQGLVTAKAKLFSKQRCSKGIPSFTDNHGSSASCSISWYETNADEKELMFTSGSSIVADRQLVGIVSTSATVRNNTYKPGLYTNVRLLKDWIEDTLVKTEAP